MNLSAASPPTYSTRRERRRRDIDGDAHTAPAGRQDRPTSKIERPLGLYIHIPFCARKCPYCDFNTYARLEPLYESYTQTLCRELTRWAPLLDGRTVQTVFMGGGTPTALSAGQLTRLFNLVRTEFSLAADAEISVEANPGIEDWGQFALLRELGVNRLSMGVQSFQPPELAFLGRIHSADDALHAFDAAVKAGFDNINLDFMFGLPQQSANAWNDTLDKALELAPQHLSLYSLIVEPETPLAHWVDTGQTPPPDDDQAAKLYEIAMARLQEAGYVHYEVSNWARGAEFACRHNLIYWRNQDWIGVGPGAHSHLRYPLSARLHRELTRKGTGAAPPKPAVSSQCSQAALRWSNRKSVPGYMKRLDSGETPVDFSEELPALVSMGETMLLGLRLVREGVAFARFEALHGQPMRAVFGPKLDRLQDAGLLESNQERVRLTARGLLLGNRVFSEFVA